MSTSKRLNDALNRLAAAEKQFLATEFLAPVIRGGSMQVRIAGVICRLNVQSADFEGWGVFRPTSHTEARLLRPARLAERQRYLELFPLIRLILSCRQDEQWLALPAHRANTRVRTEGLVPVRLVEDARLFEVIQLTACGCLTVKNVGTMSLAFCTLTLTVHQARACATCEPCGPGAVPLTSRPFV